MTCDGSGGRDDAGGDTRGIRSVGASQMGGRSSFTGTNLRPGYP